MPELLDRHNLPLLYPIPASFLVILLRYVIEKHILAPIAVSFGIKSAPYAGNPVLEQAFQSKTTWSHKQILQLSIKLGTTERNVEKWLKNRINMKIRSSKLDKFCENAWKCLYYVLSFGYGICVMWKKPWLWDISQCWDRIDKQEVTLDILLYYVFSLSFYWSLLFSQFFDVKRKDFWQMFAHHVITIVLMCSSWIFKFIRVGTLVLLVHDFADIFLESAKVMHYIKYTKTRDVCFGIFAVSWCITRLVIYPFWIIWSCLTVTFEIASWVYYYFNGMLIMLLVLHFFWTYLLVKFLMVSFIPGNMNKDIRSGSEESDVGDGEHKKRE